LYLANELDNTLTVYAYEGNSGRLREVQTLDTLPPGAPENKAADIHVSAEGKRVYVSNRGHNSIAVFAVNDNGSLQRLGYPPCGGDWPRNFSLSPDGRFMLVANRFSNEVVALPVEVGKSELGEPVTKAFVNQPTCVHFWVVE
jgi:6-phosphogluconolactonase